MNNNSYMVTVLDNARCENASLKAEVAVLKASLRVYQAGIHTIARHIGVNLEGKTEQERIRDILANLGYRAPRFVGGFSEARWNAAEAWAEDDRIYEMWGPEGRPTEGERR